MTIDSDFSKHTGLIFDCDGTLADTMPLHYVAWRSTLNRYGIEFTEDRFYAMAGQPTVHIVRVLQAEQNVDGDAVAIADEKEHAFLETLDQVEPIGPVIDVARSYRASHPMGVGSGSSRQTVERILQHLGLSDFFDAIVGSEDTPHPKPAPDVFLEVARQIGADPQGCVVFEDADLGLEAARRGGMEAFDIRSIHTPRRITEQV